MKTATIRLTAPLQSYGNPTSFNQRTSDSYPTKSAIVGMIAAALGYSREDNEKILELNDLLFAVRIEQSGKMLTEFQTVEYRKSASKTARKLTYRDFIQDGVFMVAIGSDDDQLIENIKEALKHPKFQLYLGRRSNPPAGPLKIDIFDDKNPLQVLEDLPWQASDWYKRNFKSSQFLTKIIADASLDSESTPLMKKDEVGSFDQKDRYYQYRPIVIKKAVKLKNSENNQTADNTDWDFWSFV